VDIALLPGTPPNIQELMLLGQDELD
jgi:hypothetical protein